nr:immunoglobulin heavy chain junction region [Macaca mulatta]MOW87671.1 immunoglobulin heavy chain junction region [Macaca mulatta]MOW89283.1 immunoglobulin heavy chain junction region [Macaca mulatta]
CARYGDGSNYFEYW